jgi:AbrB family looped-hinge helix DNA binding protein
MNATIQIGKSGRLVIPKAIRENLGLREGSRLQLTVAGGKLEAVPEADDVKIEMEDGLPVIRGGRKPRKGDLVKAIRADRETRMARIAHRENQ